MIESKSAGDAASDRVAEAVERIARGDLASPPGGLAAGASDEDRAPLASVDRLARQLRRVVVGLRGAATSFELVATEVLRGTRGLSESVLHEGASVEETSSSIAEINVSLRRVEESIAALSNLAQATSTSSLQMAASIDQVSGNADTLSHYVEELASAIEEMTVSVRDVAGSSEALSTLAASTVDAAAAIDASTRRIVRSVDATSGLGREVADAANAGSAVVSETARTMQSIKEASDRATESIAALGDRSEQVGAIVGVIDEIAERTNLLALNAAILAAQAGPSGRGFRIVADEIKELSERTAASTREIASLIEAVRSDVVTATERVAAGDALAEIGVEQARSAAAHLSAIGAVTARATDQIAEIAESSAVQATETHKVLEAAERVQQRADQIRRATAEQAETSRHIGERAVHMSELTEQVRRATVEQADASKHIAQAVEEVTTVVEQIRGAVGEQSLGTDHVLRAIEVIQEVVARNRQSIATINGAVDALGREAAMLRREVEQFQVPRPRRGGHLRVASRDADVELDPARATTAAAADVLENLFETLVRSGEGSDVRPGLAERWEISPDGCVYTFALRRGVRFHNLREVVAEDVRYSFERLARAEEGGGSWVLAPVAGFAEFVRGDAGRLVGVEPLDAFTLRITLDRPLAFFLATLCVPYASIVPREEVERASPSFGVRPIGCGPFRLVAYEPMRRVELERFEGFYRDDCPSVDRLTFEVGLPSTEIRDRFASGEIAYVKSPSRELVTLVERDPEARASIVRAVALHTERLIFDCAFPPFDVRDVRRAFGLAIDKARYVREVHGDAAVVASGPIPPGLLGYAEDLRGLEYDPERARALLARAGLASGLKTSVWCTRGFVPQAGAERLREDLGAVGVELEVRMVEPEEFVAARGRGLIPIAWRSWFADYPDPDNFTYALFHSTAERYFASSYRNPEVDRLAERARSVMDREERDALYRQLAALVVDDAPSVFLMHRRNVVAHQASVEGLRLHLLTPVVRPEELWLNE